VAVSARSIGDGRLEVTVGAQTLPATPANALEQIAVTAAQNGVVEWNGTLVGAGATISLSDGTATATFVVTRQVVGQATVVALTVRDRCGEWPTFVGGGPDAF
jgi:2-keto-4-pentenoate hydratase